MMLETLKTARWGRIAAYFLLVGIPTCGIAVVWLGFRLRREAELVNKHRLGLVTLGAEDWDDIIFF